MYLPNPCSAAIDFRRQNLACKVIPALKEKNIYNSRYTRNMGIKPLSPRDAIKHHFTSLTTYLRPSVLERNFHETGLSIHGHFSLLFHPHQVIFIHYEPRIATAIRGL